MTVFSYLFLEQASKVNPFPCPTTYRHALLHYVDITSLVRTNVLKELSEYCSDEKDKQHLNNITAPTDEGKVHVCVCRCACISLVNQTAFLRVALIDKRHPEESGLVHETMHVCGCVCTVYSKTFEERNFHSFCGFSLNRECFPTNYGLVDWQCKSTSMLARKFPVNGNFVP